MLTLAAFPPWPGLWQKHAGRQAMRRLQGGCSLRLVMASVLVSLFLLAGPSPGIAQQSAPSAELKRVVGRVEILSKGQTQWIPAVVGARLAEGDDIRA